MTHMSRFSPITKSFLAVTMFGFLGVSNSYANQNITTVSNQVEVPIQGLLAPSRGFDDNDDVLVVSYGNLPNACYTLGKTKVEKLSDSTGKTVIRIRQFAQKRDGGICAEEEGMPDHLKMLVPFSTEVSVGTLKAGQYELQYNRNFGGVAVRSLGVEKASVPSTDNLPYAMVTNASVLDLLNSKEDVQVTLTGVLNSTCTELDEKVRVEKVSDVFVVMPTIKVKAGVFCAQTLIPFSKTVTLGKSEVGTHLVHVRSMNGKAVNRTYQVVGS